MLQGTEVDLRGLSALEEVDEDATDVGPDGEVVELVGVEEAQVGQRGLRDDLQAGEITGADFELEVDDVAFGIGLFADEVVDEEEIACLDRKAGLFEKLPLESLRKGLPLLDVPARKDPVLGALLAVLGHEELPVVNEDAGDADFHVRISDARERTQR